VLALPPGAVTLATSSTAAHELWAYGANVLAFQFHLEFDGQLAHEKIWPAIKAAGRWGGRLQRDAGCRLKGGAEAGQGGRGPRRGRGCRAAAAL
jgi:GMP synthase-like glutamine amidotransferase